MRLFGFQITRSKAAVPAMSYANTGGAFGWFGVIREGFAGAWQSLVTVDSPRDLMAFAGLWSPVTLVAGDVSKLRLKLCRMTNGIWQEVTDSSPFLSVLRRPNHYQTRVQFIEHWVLSKLLYGNTYALKERDARGVVIRLYILDPQRVKVLVTPMGDVYYQLQTDHLSGVGVNLTVAASEIIHDRWNCLWHPLVGIAPIYAAGMSATMGRKIQNNSAAFFQNLSRPGGMLTAPGSIDEETAQRLKQEFEQNFSGQKIGRLFVGGDGLKYEGMAIPAEQAQLIEQLNWTSKDIARALHVPYFMVGGETPATATIEAETLRYYTQCIQKLLEQAEASLDDGLSLPSNLRTEFDTDGLIRMDTSAQAEAVSKLTGAGVMSPNEGRQRFNLAPVAGGDTPYLQQQNYALSALAKRDAKQDPFTSEKPQALPAPTPAPSPAPEADQTDKALYLLHRKAPEELIHA